jgi:hypothetical protein
MKKILLLRSVFSLAAILFFYLPFASAADPIIKLESFIPAEKCVMTFSVFSDGSLKYKGRHCSRRSIRIHDHISLDKIESIRKMIDQIHFCELRSEYSANDNLDNAVVVDSETLSITALCGKEQKTISIYGVEHITGKLGQLNHPDRATALRFDQLYNFILDLLMQKSLQSRQTAG